MEGASKSEERTSMARVRCHPSGHCPAEELLSSATKAEQLVVPPAADQCHQIKRTFGRATPDVRDSLPSVRVPSRRVLARLLAGSVLCLGMNMRSPRRVG